MPERRFILIMSGAVCGHQPHLRQGLVLGLTEIDQSRANPTRATAAGACGGAGPSIGGEGEAQRPLDLRATGRSAQRFSPGGEGTIIACVLAVCLTCVTWVVVEVVTQEQSDLGSPTAGPGFTVKRPIRKQDLARSCFAFRSKNPILFLRAYA